MIWGPPALVLEEERIKVTSSGSVVGSVVEDTTAIAGLLAPESVREGERSSLVGVENRVWDCDLYG